MTTRATIFIVILQMFLIMGTVIPVFGEQTAQKGPRPVTLYLFWGKGCPHCAKEELFLKKLKLSYPTLVIRDYEVWKDKKNAAFFKRVMDAAGAKTTGVPVTIVGDRLFPGFSEQTGRSIEDYVGHCVQNGCPDTNAVIDSLADVQKVLEQPVVPKPAPETKENAISLPLLGELDTGKASLPFLTVVIAGLDSFNPCAFFVLLFLLSLMIHARSRGRMLLIGGVFVFFSGAVYFLFMAAWLNVFMIIGSLTAVTAAAGTVALLLAGINIKDFFWFKKGVSLMIPEKAKPKLYERMRGLVRSPSLPAAAGGAVILAVTANAYELLCTAGFPMVYTRALTLHNLPPAAYYLYLVLYNVIYVVPLAVIVVVVTVTLGARKLTEWQGRQLKLLSGSMMLLLGIVLLVNPALLNNALAAVLLLVVAVGLSGATILLAKRIRPKLAEG